MAMTAEARHLRGRIAGLSRDRATDDPELVAARRDLTAVRLHDHIAATLATAPPHTDDQRRRLAGLFTGGASK